VVVAVVAVVVDWRWWRWWRHHAGSSTRQTRGWRWRVGDGGGESWRQRTSPFVDNHNLTGAGVGCGGDGRGGGEWLGGLAGRGREVVSPDGSGDPPVALALALAVGGARLGGCLFSLLLRRGRLRYAKERANEHIQGWASDDMLSWHCKFAKPGKIAGCPCWYCAEVQMDPRSWAPRCAFCAQMIDPFPLLAGMQNMYACVLSRRNPFAKHSCMHVQIILVMKQRSRKREVEGPDWGWGLVQLGWLVGCY